MVSRRDPSGPTAAMRGSGKSALIIVENQPYATDTRVKAESAALKEAGWRVHVICPDVTEKARRERSALYRTYDLDGIRVHSYRMGFAGYGLYGYVREYVLSMFHIARLSLRLFRTDGFDVIHLCNPPDTLFMIGIVFKLFGRKVIFDHHDLFPEMILTRHRGLVRRVLYHSALALEFLTFRTADAVLSTNHSYRRIAMVRGRVKTDDIFVVRNGPRSDEIVPVPADPGLKKGFASMACYAGIMGPEDGVLELMQVIRHIVLRLRRTDVLFCLLGDGAARNEALDLARAWHIESCIDMPGMVLDRPLFCRYLSTADIMLAPEMANPHNNRSTFIKIAEYMAIGKPIVAYDLVETRYTAGDAAVYVQSGDTEAYAAAIVALLDDPVRRAAMGSGGVERIKAKFRWEHQKGELLNAYGHVLHKGSERRPPARPQGTGRS
ncbi:MAG: glycosyltransferase family 4 protein [Acidobacteria bacterium]|nr:glycosyltransferase family 4 protein [Acidobacteriota bacterium]